MRAFTIRELATAGLIASLYTVLSLAFQPISFGVYQIRISEALTVLPFLTPAAIPGLYIGCLLSNVLGNMGWVDIVVGPLLTLVAAFLTRRTVVLTNARLNLRLAVIPIVLMWGVAIWLLCGGQFTGKTISGIALSIAAYLPLINIWRHRSGGEAAVAYQARLMYVIGLVIALVAVWQTRATDEAWFIISGALLQIMALAGAAMLFWTAATNRNPNLLLAPLPPVVLNAFGVAVYLAPIMGTSYWFAVQMIGVGQLIACYLLGLPLLLLLQRRRLLT